MHVCVCVFIKINIFTFRNLCQNVLMSASNSKKFGNVSTLDYQT